LLACSLLVLLIWSESLLSSSSPFSGDFDFILILLAGELEIGRIRIVELQKFKGMSNHYSEINSRWLSGR
jgi:hypothetical protein